ncbi:MAG: DNA topoisomerase VI subunit B [Candidatus Aenigmatarchaeota archaeon]
MAESKIRSAEELASKLREISIAEFFEKNRHLLGFDNPAKALLTVVKEAVDNSLDACEDARILPEIGISIKEPRQTFKLIDEKAGEIGQMIREEGKAELSIGDEKGKLIEIKEPRQGEISFIFEHGDATYKLKIFRKNEEEAYEAYRNRTELKVAKQPADRFLIAVEDNGPGIMKEHIPRVFGKLLYGSKFAGGKQGRGQQGIGISAALLYSQLTTGKPAKIWSRTASNKPIWYYELRIDTTKNEPIIIEEKQMKHFNGESGTKEHGIRIELEVEGKWIQRHHSVEEYIKQTAAVNPFANIIYRSPEGETFEYKRAVEQLPPQARSIKPHPHGVEMGMLERMLKLTDSRSLSGFLGNEFVRVGGQAAAEVCKLAKVKLDLKPNTLDHEQVERLWRTMQSYAFMKPPTDCLSPIGEETFMEGIKKEYQPEFLAAVTRPPSVYRGNPFQIEVVIGYGGEALKQQNSAKIMRFANRVPLLYQAASCATTKSVQKVDWRHYGMEQQSGIPSGPVIVAVHMASVWIPYISEAKEAIDPYPVIIKEMKLALQEAGRRLQHYMAGRKRKEDAAQRTNLFERYIPIAAEAIAKLAETQQGKLEAALLGMLKKGDAIKEAEQSTDAEKLPEPEKKKEEEGE